MIRAPLSGTKRAGSVGSNNHFELPNKATISAGTIKASYTVGFI